MNSSKSVKGLGGAVMHLYLIDSSYDVESETNNFKIILNHHLQYQRSANLAYIFIKNYNELMEKIKINQFNLLKI